MKVKVKNVDIRYNDKLYSKDTIFKMEEEDYEGLEEYLEVIEEPNSESQIGKENLKDNSPEEFEESEESEESENSDIKTDKKDPKNTSSRKK